MVTKIRAVFAGMLAIGIVLVLSLAADAQDAASTADPGTMAVGWVCANQQLVGWAITALLAHAGFSGLSALLKKAGVSDATQSRYANLAIKLIRLLAVDVKPPPTVVVAQGEKLQATGVVPVQPPPVVQNPPQP